MDTSNLRFEHSHPRNKEAPVGGCWYKYIYIYDSVDDDVTPQDDPLFGTGPMSSHLDPPR